MVGGSFDYLVLYKINCFPFQDNDNMYVYVHIRYIRYYYIIIYIII